jgi:hypothetical protein
VPFIANLDFVEKYRPMLQILADIGDLEEMTAEPGYTLHAGKRYRELRLRAVRGYMEELAQDFEHLKTALMDKAILDAELAEALKEIERNLLRFFRQTRVRIFLERLFPTPKPSPAVRRVRLLRAIIVPLFTHAKMLTAILRTMDSFGATGET